MIIEGTEDPDYLVGGSGDDVIYGFGGDDTLEGQGGGDQLFGGAGRDHLYGGASADFLDGGADFDLVRYDTSMAGVTVDLSTNTGVGGDAQGDTFNAIEGVVGSNFADVLIGNDVGNILYGLGGDDVLYGISDSVIQTGGPDALYGGDGNDHLFLGLATQIVDGGAGYDIARYDYFSHGVSVSISALTSIEALVGSNWNDQLSGDGGDNVLYGLSGDDVLNGGGGADSLYGGDGSDQLYAGEGADRIDGGTGYDLVRYDQASTGVLVNLSQGGGDGGAAGDIYVAVEGVVGSLFNDTIIGDGQGNTLYGLDGDDTLFGNNGSFGADGGNVIEGGAGNDHLYSGAGDDILNGGDGFDFARYDYAPPTGMYSGVTIDLQAGKSTHYERDTLISIEGLVGSIFNDVLVGSDGANIIYGGTGDDTIKGGAGDDKLYGNAGGDRFYFESGSGADQILDFDFPGAGHDLIGISMNLNGSDIVNYATLLPHIQESMMAGITIDLGGGANVYAPNLHMTDVTADLFFFYAGEFVVMT